MSTVTSRRQKSRKAAPPAPDMKERIKGVAIGLLIRNGYRGASFANIAKPLGITTTNIHYHFGSKQKLVEAAVKDYVAGSLAGHQRVWLDETTTLRAKLRAVLAFNRARYDSFNRGKVAGRPWSLIARLRLEGEVAGAGVRAELARFTEVLHRDVRQAVQTALDRGELKPDAPLDDIAFLIANIVDSSGVFTQDAGDFERLERLFATVENIMLAAYAADPRAAG
jgi:TetR/AcrR family transcriptional regulator, transcriptional repressor for nem operon